MDNIPRLIIFPSPEGIIKTTIMKKLLIAMLFIAGLNTVQSQAVPELTLGRNTYQIVAGSELDNTLRAYDEGYNVGIASGGTNGLVSMNFVSGREPVMSIYQNENTYELQFSYEVNVTGSGAGVDKYYNANGATAAFVYIEFLNIINHGSSTDGQWHRPVFRLVFEYDYQFGNASQGPSIIGSTNTLPNFVRDLVDSNTRATHARITIQHQTGVRLNRIIEITLPE